MDNVGWNYDWQSARIQADIEARKADTALIRQLVDALEYHVEQTRPISRTEEAIAAGRARLEGKP